MGAAFVLTLGTIFFVTGVGFVAFRGGALGAFVNLSIGISEPDGDVSHFFLSKPDCLHSRNGLDHSGFAMGNVADGADIDGCLPTDDLWGGGAQRGDILVQLLF